MLDAQQNTAFIVHTNEILCFPLYNVARLYYLSRRWGQKHRE